METETPDHPQSPCQPPSLWLCLPRVGCMAHTSSQHKALQSRWCPRPRQVPPAFHVTMGVWPGRCPSHLFPGYCDLRSYPHLAAGAAVVEQPLLSPLFPACHPPGAAGGKTVRGCPLYAFHIHGTPQQHGGAEWGGVLDSEEIAHRPCSFSPVSDLTCPRALGSSM